MRSGLTQRAPRCFDLRSASRSRFRSFFFVFFLVFFFLVLFRDPTLLSGFGSLPLTVRQRIQRLIGWWLDSVFCTPAAVLRCRRSVLDILSPSDLRWRQRICVGKLPRQPVRRGMPVVCCHGHRRRVRSAANANSDLLGFNCCLATRHVHQRQASGRRIERLCYHVVLHERRL